MKTYLSACLVPCALLALASCGHKNSGRDEAIPVIDVAKPVVDSVVLHKSFPGVLSAFREVDVVARVDGYLESKNYTSGSLVQAGAVLFTIEDTQYRDALSRAQAALQTAVSQRDYAKSHYEALQRAYTSEAVSRMEVEQGRSALETAEAAIESARANISTARTQLGYCTVRAPFTGHITSATVDVGAYVSGSGAPVKLATIYEDDFMNANFSVDDAGIVPAIAEALRREGTDYSAIPLSFSDSLEHSYTGDLQYMSPAVNTSTGTVALQADIKNPYNELHSGMYVNIDLPYGFDPQAILVLDAAIGRDQRGSYLYVVNDSNRVVYKPVITGQSVADSMRIITSGIAPDDRYVTRALLKVRPGMTVNPRLTE